MSKTTTNIFFLIVTFFSIMSWRCIQAQKQELFEGICISFVEKVDGVADASIIDSNSFIRYSNSEYMVYKFPKIVYKENKTKLAGESLEIEFINPDTTFKYFIIRKNADIGLQYNDNFNNASPFLLDSLLKEIGLHSSNLKVYSLKLGKPSKVERKQEGFEIEKYGNKKESSDDPDSVFRYYDKKLSETDFSFSHELDKQKRSKLIKTSFIYLKGKNTKKLKVSSSELSTGFEKINITDTTKLNLILKKYKHDAKAFKLN